MKQEHPLNFQQHKIVDNPLGVKLVVSGPGTGKTTVICHYLSAVIQNGMAQPEDILAVTFTNKAADEMRERVAAMAGVKLSISTIHSFASGVLRRYPPPGFTSDYQIIDDRKQYGIIANLIRQLQLDHHPRYVLEKLTLARSLRDRQMLVSLDLERLYRNYVTMMRQENSVDYDDLLTWCAYVLENNPQALAYYRGRYRFLLVDEFQDTNPVQYAILKLLMKEGDNFLCVGDFDQSIYGFRGADMNIILGFETDFPKAETYFLEENYRSTQRIVQAANQLIRHNKKRRDKSLRTSRGGGEEIVIASFADEEEEAQHIAQIIEGRVKKGVPYDNFAVLYRIHTLSRELEETFSTRGIPYQIIGGLGYFQRREIQNVLAFMELVRNSEDLGALQKVIRLLYQINGVNGYNRNQTMTIDQLPYSNYPFIQGLPDHIHRLSKLTCLEDMYNEIISNTGYLRYLRKDTSSEGERRLESVEELRSTLVKFDQRGTSLDQFLIFIGQVQAGNETNSVKLLTVHGAKGMEFDTVFLVGVQAGMFPHYNAETEEQIEEERRLFYVGVTRAKDQLHISFPRVRTYKGKKVKTQRSPFIKELSSPPDKTNKKINNRRDSRKGLQLSQVQEGSVVLHDQFGHGEIIDIGATSIYGTEVKIAFQDRERSIILELAPLILI